MGDDAPHGARSSLKGDLVLARDLRVVPGFPEVDAGKDTDQNAEDCRRDAGCVVSPVNQRGSDRGADYRAKTSSRREPAKALRAVIWIAGIGDVCLNDADSAPAQALYDA